MRSNKPRFLFSFGPNDGRDSRIYCTSCWKNARMVPDTSGEVTEEDVDRYKRSHKCGDPGDAWDLAPVEPML